MTIAKRRTLLAGGGAVLAAAVAIAVLATSSCACGRGHRVVRPVTRGQIASKFRSSVAAAPTPSSRRLSTRCAPRPNETMTNTVSHLCGFADTTNTGVPVGTKLYRVPQDIAGPNAQTGHGWSWNSQYGYIAVGAGGLLTNVEVKGTVSVQGDDAAVQDSDISVAGANSYAVELRHANNVTIRSNNLHGPVQTPYPDYCDNGIRDIYGDSENLTVKNNNIWYCASGLNNILNGGLIDQNYIHDNGHGSPDDHTNGIQFEAGSAELMTVRDNTIFNPLGQTDAIILSNDYGGVETNRVIDHNLIGGGGYCFYGAGGPSLMARHIVFTNNHFSRLYHSACGYWGPIANWNPRGGDVLHGNVWDETGSVVTP